MHHIATLWSTMDNMVKANCDVERKSWTQVHVEFSASSGLFKRFKDHYSIDNVKVSGESSSADVKAAEKIFGKL